MLKLRMSLNLQKMLTLPKKILKPESRQKEKQIKEYTGSTIRKNRVTHFLFFSLTKRPSVLGQKINDMSKIAKIGSKNFATLNSQGSQAQTPASQRAAGCCKRFLSATAANF